MRVLPRTSRGSQSLALQRTSGFPDLWPVLGLGLGRVGMREALLGLGDYHGKMWF